MSLMNRARKQDAVWWHKISTDAYGTPTYSEPHPIRVRWDDEDHIVKNEAGEDVECHGSVMVDFALYRDEGFRAGDLLWEGKLDDWRGSMTQPKEDGAVEVISLGRTPNLKATATLLIVSV